MCSECDEAEFQRLLLPDWNHITVGCSNCGLGWGVLAPPEFTSMNEIECPSCGYLVTMNPIPEMLCEGVDND